ncbi:MAG TPA: hypothetical protein VF858_05785 [Gemmatimonadaceae bacterium]
MMLRDGAIIFGDLIGKLDVRGSSKGGRSGKYRLAALIARYGRAFTWIEEITGDCPRKLARRDSDPCGLINSETACPK